MESTGRRVRALIVAAVLMIGAAGAGATAGAAQERGPTALQLTPYLWATGAGGTIQPFAGAPTVEIDRSFSDLIEDLDIAFFLSGLARVDRFVLVGDFSTASASRAGLVAVPGVGVLPGEGRLRQTSFTVASGYRAVDARRGTLDLLLGARAWWVRGTVDLAGVVSRSPRIDFIDPIVAARGNLALAPGWSAIAYADVGGFGRGSDLTFQLLGTVNYRVSDRIFLSAGYRHLEVDYSSGGTEVDMRMSGPLIGATFRF